MKKHYDSTRPKKRKKKKKNTIEGAEEKNMEHYDLTRPKKKTTKVAEPSVEADDASVEVFLDSPVKIVTDADTQYTTQIEDSSKLTFREPHVGVNNWMSKVSMEWISQGCLMGCTERFLILYAILKEMSLLSKKVVIFFSTHHSVMYHSKLLQCLNIKCHAIHGKTKQLQRAKIISEFSSGKLGFLLCTNVVHRLAISVKDLIIQYDPLSEPKEYIQKLLQSVEDQGAQGKNLLFLSPEQNVLYLRHVKVIVKQWKFIGGSQYQLQLENLVGSDISMCQLAKLAYKSYLAAYRSHTMNMFFNIENLNLQEVVTSFFLGSPPE